MSVLFFVAAGRASTPPLLRESPTTTSTTTTTMAEPLENISVEIRDSITGAALPDVLVSVTLVHDGTSLTPVVTGRDGIALIGEPVLNGTQVRIVASLCGFDAFERDIIIDGNSHFQFNISQEVQVLISFIKKKLCTLPS